MAIAEGLFWGAFINSGQTCACLKRLYVHDRIYDAVCEALAAYAGQIKVGDGLTDDNVLGAASQLASHGIDVVADLPGVGENYQDHPEATVQAEMRDSSSLFGQDRGPAAVGHMLQYMLTKTGVLTSNVVESGGLVDTAGTGQQNIQFHVLPSFNGFGERLAHSGHGISIARVSCDPSHAALSSCDRPIRTIRRCSTPTASPIRLISRQWFAASNSQSGSPRHHRSPG